MDQAIESEKKAVELCESAENIEDTGYAYLIWQWCYLYKGEFDQVLALKENAIRILEDRFSLRLYTWALGAASLAFSWLGRWDEAEEEGREVLRVAEEFSNSSIVSFAAYILATAYTHKGDMNQALEYAELAVRKSSTPAGRIWAETWLAWAWCRAGQLSKGVEVLAGVVSTYKASRWVKGESYAQVMLGEGYWLAGEHHKARQNLIEGLEVAERCGMKYHVGWAHRLLGETAQEKNGAGAAHHFEQSISVLREIGAENELALAYTGYGRLLKKEGNISKAREYLSRAVETLERLGTLIDVDEIRLELRELSGS